MPETLMPYAVVSDEEDIMTAEEGCVADETIWRTCSSCKGGIKTSALYWTCSVSTCNRKRTALFFCTVSCWDAHLPVARHRDAWAEEQRAPGTASAEADESADPATRPKRRLVRPEATERPSDDWAREILVIASRLKDYVRARSGFNTSERALGPLSEILRVSCDAAIENARREGRKTVLDRDIPKP